MRSLGWPEILLILVAVLVIFGANRLPQLGRAVGDTFREFKKSVRPDEAQSDEESPKKT